VLCWSQSVPIEGSPCTSYKTAIDISRSHKAQSVSLYSSSYFPSQSGNVGQRKEHRRMSTPSSRFSSPCKKAFSNAHTRLHSTTRARQQLRLFISRSLFGVVFAVSARKGQVLYHVHEESRLSKAFESEFVQRSSKRRSFPKI
jgi:hypothetical protein